MVAQIKSSDVEAVAERSPRAGRLEEGQRRREGRKGAKKIEKKLYEGLTGGLGRPTMYTRRVYPATSGPMDRSSVRPSIVGSFDDVQRRTFLRRPARRDPGEDLEILAPR